MGVKENSVPWDDVFDPRYDEKSAPSLWEVVLGEAPPIYADPNEFFKRTYLTKTMKESLAAIAQSLRGEGRKVILLTSLFGGGKTHTLLAIYHAFKTPQSLSILDSQLTDLILEAGEPEIIVLDADSSKLVPSPIEPYREGDFEIKTVWGMLAHKLGAYKEVKDYDSPDSPPPPTDKLRGLLRDQKVIILIDEIVKYIASMRRSKLRNYGENVITFLENLAKAVEGVDTALVVTIPADYREGTPVPEETYREDTNKVLRSISRVSSMRLPPITSGDIAKVLRKRIFQKVSEEYPRTFYETYRDNPDVFGDESNWDYVLEEGNVRYTLRETYPFHPKYLEAISDFVVRNKDLQKTRDAIKISRKVVRSVWSSEEDPEAIMPWHLDLSNSEIRSDIITQSYSDFDQIVSKDIISPGGSLGNVRHSINPDLAVRLATVIFLRTYIYESTKAIKPFPKFEEIAVSVYEPAYFNSHSLMPVDIRDVLSDLTTYLVHLQEDDGRYWFTRYPSAVELAQKRAEEIFRNERGKLLTKFAEVTKSILFPSKKKGKGEIQRSELFDKSKSFVVSAFNQELASANTPDGPEMKLVVIADESASEDLIRQVIFYEGEKPRTYKNTVVVVSPVKDGQGIFPEILRKIARHLAAEEVKDSLPEYYQDKDLIKLQERRLKNFSQRNYEGAQQASLGYLRSVNFPKDINEVGTVEASIGVSIASQTEEALTNPPYIKYRRDFDFDDLVNFLKMVYNRDLIEGEERIPFSTLLNWFTTNPKANFMTRSMLERVVKSGVDRLSIGIITKEGSLYWRKDDGPPFPKTPGRIRDDDEVVSYKIAARELINNLLKREGEEETLTGIRRTWFEIEFGGEVIKLRELVNMEGYEDIIKEGTINKKVEEIESELLVEPDISNVEARPGEEVRIPIHVRVINYDSGTVRLSASMGQLDPQEGDPDFESTLIVKAPEAPKSYTIEIRAEDSAGKEKVAQVTLKVKSERETKETKELSEAFVGWQLVGLSSEDPETFVRALQNFKDEENASVSANLSSGQISLEINDLDAYSALSILRTLADKLRDLGLDEGIDFRGELFLPGEPIDQIRYHSLNSLSGKVIFRLQAPERE